MPSSIEDEPESTTSTITHQSATSSSRTEDRDPLAVIDTRSRRGSRIPERFRRDRERALAGRSNRELIRLLIQEEYESKDTRKLLSAAFDRLELEARRVDDAEARVLEVAERFRTVNDARVASQKEAAQANTELRMYKYQYDLAQKEILRAQDVLKMIEGQRDDAAAAATRARDAARMYRENQLVYVAREEGRKMGYEEGLRHAKYEYGGVRAMDYAGRYPASRERVQDRLITDEPFNRVPQEGSIADDEHSPESVGLPEYSEAANRTKLAIQQPTLSPLLSPVSIPFRPSHPTPWDDPETGTPITPTILHNRIPGPHPEPPIPPDGWIPRSEQDSTILIPPAHEFEPQIPSPSSGTTWVHVSTNYDQSPYSATRPSLSIPEQHNRRGSSPSPISEGESNGSTTFSQFDITATVPEDSSVLERKLSMIQEASTQGELTPASSARPSRVENILTNENTPALETDYGYSPATDMTLRSPAVQELADSGKLQVFKPGDSRRNIMQRFADGLRYSDPDLVETWRRSAAEELGPSNRPPRRRPSYLTTPAPLSPTSAVSPSQLHTSSRSSGIPIDVHSPSTPEYYDEDGPHTPGLLSPYALPQERPVTSPSDDSFTSESRIVYPQSPRRSSKNGPPAMYASGSQTPRAMSPNRDPRDKRRSKSTPRNPVNRSHTPHEMAPIPEGNSHSNPGPRSTNVYAPKIASSHSVGSVGIGSPRESASRAMHDRLSMHAGATPAHSGRPISAVPREVKEATIRRMPSTSSSMSGRSRTSSYKAYDPGQYLDPAYLASSDELSSVPSAAAAPPRSGNASGKGKWILGR